MGIKPWTFEKLIQLLDAQASRLWNHKKCVDNRNEAPAGEEKEGAPIVRCL